MLDLLKKLPTADKLVSIESIYIDTITIYLLITNLCNYKCEYCYNRNNNQIIDFDIDKTILYIKTVFITTHKKLLIYIVGGEPTISNKLYEFCYKMQDILYVDIKIHTNFSQKIKYYLEFLKLKNVSFIFSWHSINNNINNCFLKNTNLLKLLIPIDIFSKQSFIVMYEHNYISYALSLYLNLCNIENIDVELSLISLNEKKMLDMHNYTFNELNTAYLIIKNTTNNDIILNYIDGSKFAINDFIYYYLIYLLYFKTNKKWRCSAGSIILYMYNNLVYPCSAMVNSVNGISITLPFLLFIVLNNCNVCTYSSINKYIV